MVPASPDLIPASFPTVLGRGSGFTVTLTRIIKPSEIVIKISLHIYFNLELF